jgi:transposase
MPRAHIGGDSGQQFWDLVGPVDPRRVLLVGIDVSKPSWFVLGSDLIGEVVLDGAKLMADAAGLEQLVVLLHDTRRRLNAQVVVVGVEATGHFHQTLAAHLSDIEDVIVRLVNPAAVTAVRKAQLNRRRKTDWLDAAAICELLRRGEGSPSHLHASAASTLRVLWSGRKDLVDARSGMRHQAHALIDCLWPGLTAKDSAAGLRPLFRDVFDIKAARVIVGLLAEGWTPADFAATDVDALRRLFAARGCRLVRPHAQRIITRARAALAPHPAAATGKALMLGALLSSMAQLDVHIAEIEAEMGRLLADTQGAKLTQVRGIGVVAAAGFVAFVGDTSRWSEWSRVWRAAGLDPARSQSGPRDSAFGISREGSAWGRRAVMDLTVSVLRQRGPRQDRYLAARAAGKPSGIAITAEGNRLGRMCFALMASGDDYNADHETTRRQTREAGDRAA